MRFSGDVLGNSSSQCSRTRHRMRGGRITSCRWYSPRPGGLWLRSGLDPVALSVVEWASRAFS